MSCWQETQPAVRSPPSCGVYFIRCMRLRSNLIKLSTFINPIGWLVFYQRIRKPFRCGKNITINRVEHYRRRRLALYYEIINERVGSFTFLYVWLFFSVHSRQFTGLNNTALSCFMRTNVEYDGTGLFFLYRALTRRVYWNRTECTHSE